MPLTSEPGARGHARASAPRRRPARGAPAPLRTPEKATCRRSRAGGSPGAAGLLDSRRGGNDDARPVNDEAPGLSTGGLSLPSPQRRFANRRTVATSRSTSSQVL